MHGTVVEVKNGTLHTFEGDEVEVHGGAYLSPEAFLTTNGELERLRDKQARLEERSALVPSLIAGAALLGLAAGFYLGSRSDDD
jgi:hypothetical protein